MNAHCQSEPVIPEGQGRFAGQAPRAVSENPEERQLAAAQQLQSMADQLVAERELFRSFLDSMPVEVYLKDGAGRILFYNRRLADRFGISQTEWLGKTSYDLWPQEKANLIRAEEEYAKAQPSA